MAAYRFGHSQVRPGYIANFSGDNGQPFLKHIFDINAGHDGPDPDDLSGGWGTEERLQELFGEGVSSLEATRRTYFFRYPSATYFVDYFRDYYGPTLKAFESLDEAGRDALSRDLEGLLEDWNTSDDETLVVPSDYLEVVAVKR